MRNPILETIGNTQNNTGSLLDMLSEINTKIDMPRTNNRVSLLNTLQANSRAKLPTRNTNTPVATNNSSESNLGDFIDNNRGLKYSQEKRYQDGYGDCSTFACNLQREVYGKRVPDTTLGMMDKGRKVDSVKPGTISIYNTGKGNRHAVTWLPNGNVIQLGTTGVKERPGNYYSNRYPLLGNYEF